MRKNSDAPPNATWSDDRPWTLPWGRSLGWSEFFADQVVLHEAHLVPCRIAAVHRSRLSAVSPAGAIKLTLPPQTNTGDFAVGDWVLADPQTRLLQRRLARRTVLERRNQGN